MHEELKKEFINEADKYTLEIIKLKLMVSEAEAERHVALSDLANMLYSHVILQFADRYNLSRNDAISDSGEILRNVNDSLNCVTT